MSKTLRTYDENISKFRRDFTLIVDTRFDDEIGKLAYQLNTTKAWVYREGAKRILQENGIAINEDWL